MIFFVKASIHKVFRTGQGQVTFITIQYQVMTHNSHPLRPTLRMRTHAWVRCFERQTLSQAPIAQRQIVFIRIQSSRWQPQGDNNGGKPISRIVLHSIPPLCHRYRDLQCQVGSPCSSSVKSPTPSAAPTSPGPRPAESRLICLQL